MGGAGDGMVGRRRCEGEENVCSFRLKMSPSLQNPQPLLGGLCK